WRRTRISRSFELAPPRRPTSGRVSNRSITNRRNGISASYGLADRRGESHFRCPTASPGTTASGAVTEEWWPPLPSLFGCSGRQQPPAPLVLLVRDLALGQEFAQVGDLLGCLETHLTSVPAPFGETVQGDLLGTGHGVHQWT